MTSQTLAAAVLIATIAAASAAHAAPVTVKLAQGLLRGNVIEHVASFKRVPFAAAPVGERRWRPPQTAPSWKGVRDATSFGAACMQMRVVPAEMKQSEDCLFLNVWAPANLSASAKRPVMVWIHGGSFLGGSGSDPIYDGTHFAERGVVLVTLNYRLGRLGIFAHPAISAEQPGQLLGNYGLMDNLAALRWVRDNISVFGGDASNVMVFGESAGGAAVNDLMASPLARGLFAKALSESAFSRLPVVPWIDAEREGIEYAAGLGVTATGSSALKGLRALTAEQLSRPPPGWVIPVVDGNVLPEAPIAAFAARRELKVPYIAGGNSWEASLIPTRNHLESAGSLREPLIAAYGGIPGQSMLWDIATDAGVIEPNRLLARLHSNNGQKAWLYYDSYLPVAQRDTIHGVPHGGEVMYVFGNLPRVEFDWANNLFPAATPDDRIVSDAFLRYWVAFAESSDPGSAGGTTWPLYQASTEMVLEFGEDGIRARPAFHKDRLDLVEQLAEQRAQKTSSEH